MGTIRIIQTKKGYRYYDNKRKRWIKRKEFERRRKISTALKKRKPKTIKLKHATGKNFTVESLDQVEATISRYRSPAWYIYLTLHIERTFSQSKNFKKILTPRNTKQVGMAEYKRDPDVLIDQAQAIINELDERVDQTEGEESYIITHITVALRKQK